MQYNKKKNKLYKAVKDTTSLGVASMVGISSLGQVKKLAPSQASGVFNLASTGISLVNTKQLLKNTKSIFK